VNIEHDRRARRLPAAAAVYLVLTLALTWPLAAGVARDLPGDFGDPLFTSWVLAWDATHLGRGWWSANIFAPQPLALAYSEHFLPQALQTWPVYAATGNPILCYNLLFLSTFVLAAIGMFAFSREITGSDAAAFVAGLAFAFTPYRIASIPHLQVLSSAWMPFVLLGLRRYFATGRARPLAGATCAWTLQNLSCGYYLIFFSPIVLAYVAWEMTRAGLWRDRRTLLHLAIACAAVAAVTAPFMAPYVELRRMGFSPRSIEETRRFSADVYAYLTADPNLRLWGPIAQGWPHAEGVLFPGLTIAILAIIGTRAGSPEGLRYRSGRIARPDDDARDEDRSGRIARPDGDARDGDRSGRSARPDDDARDEDRSGRIARPDGDARDRDRSGPIARPDRDAEVPRGNGEMVALQIAGAVWIAVVVALLLGYSIRLPGIKITSLTRAFAVGCLAGAVLLAASRRARAVARAWVLTPAGFFTLVALFGIAMSFGPEIHARGRPVASANIYTPFYALVPGFDGLRVPARYATIVSLALAALAALAVAAAGGRVRRRIAIVASVLIVGEAIAVPIPVNQNSIDYGQRNLAPLPPSVAIGSAAPPVYDAVARLPPSAVLLELPLGEPAFDIRYMFYSMRHWRRLVNGYSGGAPASYVSLTHALVDAAAQPDRAWREIAASTATHVVVHERAYADAEGRRLSDWLRGRGAREIASLDGDRLFALP